jgi:hypothetical protein
MIPGKQAQQAMGVFLEVSFLFGNKVQKNNYSHEPHNATSVDDRPQTNMTVVL